MNAHIRDELNRPLSFIHAYEPGGDRRRAPLLLLHGPGGDEAELLGIGRAVAPGAALLAPRGQAMENGRPRFIRRLPRGVSDDADLQGRVDDLASFIVEALAAYGLARPIVMGFSNGATMAAALLLSRPALLAGAALLRPMSPFDQAPFPLPDLRDKPVLMVSGAMDPIVAANNVGRLASDFRAGGAKIDHHTGPVGHGLSPWDLTVARQWFDALPRAIVTEYPNQSPSHQEAVPSAG